jgi:hypothetical protein
VYDLCYRYYTNENKKGYNIIKEYNQTLLKGKTPAIPF